MKCGVCGVEDSDKPMCFKDLPYCSHKHRILLEDIAKQTPKHVITKVVIQNGKTSG